MEGFTIAAAVLGVALGLWNFWRDVNRARLRLRVKPQAWIESSGFHGLSIEVVNLSEYPVTITAVGILLEGDEHLEWQFIPRDRVCCPHRLEPRDAVSFRAAPGAEKNAQLIELGRLAFARTACGSTVTGGSPYLRSILRKR